MTQHFNGLTPAEQERLVLVNEECAEVQKEVSKILRHGFASTNPTLASCETNREGLQAELGDLLHAVRMLISAGDVSGEIVEAAARNKARCISVYLHHQDVGTGGQR